MCWAAVLTAGAAFGQTAAPQPDTAALASPLTKPAPDTQPAAVPIGVTEVVVTATRRSVDLQKVAGTVEALPAATLKAFDITGILQLPNVTPGLKVAPSGGNNLYLRGIGSASTGYNEAQVAVYIDGLYVPNPSSGIYSFNNIDQIEVLKGPQGTLYGRNATAGLISIATRDPDKRPRLDASFSYGNYDTSTENVYASTPLTDTLAANVALFHSEQDRGYALNVFDGHRVDEGTETGLESKLVWTPTSTTKVTGSFIFDHNNRDYGYTYQVYPGTIANDGTPYLGRYRVSDRVDPQSPFTSYTGSLKIQQDVGFANLMSLTGYQTSHEDTLFPGNAPDPGNLLPGGGVTLDDFVEGNRTWSEELQITSKPSSSRLDWVGGFFYYHDITKQGLSTFPICTGTTAASCAPGVPTTTNGYPVTASYSGYADATYRIFSSTHLTGGLRYTDETKSLTGSAFPFAGRPDSVANLPAGSILFPGQPSALFPQGIPTSLHFTKLTYRAVLSQDFGPNIHAYVSDNLGFKSGAFNPTNFNNAPVAPELLDAYEAGIKTELFNRRVRFNAAYFYYDYTNVQVRSSAPPAPPGNALLENVANEHVKGVDADFTWVATSNLTFNGSAEFLDAKYDQYPGTTIELPATKVVNGVLVGSPIVIQNANLAGLTVYNSPPVSISLGAVYKKETPYGTFAVTGNDHITSAYPISPDSTLKERPLNLVDASFLWTNPTKRYDFQIYIRNVFDRYTFINGLESNSFTVEPGTPRVFGATVGVHF